MAASTLIDHAYAKMWDLYRNHDHEVGSRSSADRTGKQVTDCITYVQNVLRYAYKAVERPEVSRRINFAKGTDLAVYLVGLGWQGCYWNPDVLKPRDEDAEHPFSHHRAVKTGKYYGIKVNSYAVNYRRQAPTPAEPDNRSVLRRLKQVKFAYGLARGGMHTFLFSYGLVFEVHWAEVGAKLYEKSPFELFDYNSGALIIPPGARFVGDPAKMPSRPARPQTETR